VCALPWGRRGRGRKNEDEYVDILKEKNFLGLLFKIITRKV
jgi:hypothetical protein